MHSTHGKWWRLLAAACLLTSATDASTGNSSVPGVALLVEWSQLSCVARDDASRSAMTWITPIEDYQREPHSEISGGERAAFTRWTSTGWRNVSSRNTPAPPLTDRRWEDLTVEKTTGFIASYISLGSIPSGAQSWEVGLSVRAAHDAQILLCGDGGLFGDCYWIILGGWYKKSEGGGEDKGVCVLRLCTGGSVPKNETYPEGDCDTVRASHARLMVSEDRWLHLRLRWNVTRNFVAVWELGDSKPFLLFNDTNLFRPTELLVRSRHVPALWKRHDYTFLYTETPGSSIFSQYQIPNYDRVCISLQYFVSPQSSLQISAYGETFEDYHIEDDGQWHEVHLLSVPRKAKTSVGLTVTATKKEGDEPSRFGIGNVRECNPDGETRISRIPDTNAACQLVQYRGLSLRPKASYDTGCTSSIYDRVDQCRSLLSRSDCYGVAICRPRTNAAGECCCASGWSGTYCNIGCDAGTYGPGCQLQCGKCSIPCSAVDGTCEGVCVAGYHNTRCEDKYPVLEHAPVVLGATHTSLQIEVANLKYAGVGNPHSIRVDFKMTREDDWRHRPSLRIESGSPFTTTIPSLTPGVEYMVRAILVEHNEKFYAAEDVPYTAANTTCDEPTVLSATPGRRNVTITLKANEPTAQNCPWKWFSYEVLHQGVVKKTGTLDRTNIIVQNLDPHTEYDILVLRDGNVTSRTNSTTLQGAPSAVRNLEVVGQSSSTIRVQWEAPVPANGDIKRYNIRYQHDRFRACTKRRSSPESRGNTSTTELSAVLEGLLPYSKYSVAVRAETVEEGPEEETDGSTDEVDVPVARPVLRTYGVTRASAGVSWTVPDCAALQGPADTFKVVTKGASPWNQDDARTETVRARSIVLTNLVPFSNYTATVYVLSSGGASNPDSPSITFETQPDGPPVVQDLQAYSHGPDWISLRWRNPYPPHGILQGYREWHSIYSWSHERGEDITNDSRKCLLWPDMVCCTVRKPPLAADREYRVQVRAINQLNLLGQPMEIAVTTTEGVPSAPLNLTATHIDGQNVTLTWTHPWLPRGALKGFTIKPVVLSTRLKDRNSSGHQDIDIILGKDNKSSTYNYTITDLSPSTHFSILLWAYSSVQGEQNSMNVVTPFVPPKFSSAVTVDRARITNSSVEVVLPAAPQFLTDKSTCFVVVTLLEGTMQELEDKVRLQDDSLKTQVLALARTHSTQLAWIAAEIELKSEPQTFVVGADKKRPTRATTSSSATYGEGYANHPLGPNCTYQVTVVALCEQDGKIMFSASQLQEPVATSGTPLTTDASNFNLLALLLLLVLVPAVAYFVIKRYRKKKATKKADEILLHVSDDKPGSKIGTPDSDIAIGVKVKTKPPLKEPEVMEVTPLAQRLSNRVALNRLEEYVKVALVSGELQRQHALFPRGATQPCEYGRLPQNKSKNRYGNLIAYDATRVALKKLPEDPFSDYINANYIDGYKCPKFYIATQGPKPNTVNDFWRMVWQEQVQVICMLANVVENGKTKCEQYWPDLGREESYGEVAVMTASSQVFADYTFRRLRASHGNKRRAIQHFHFTSWPDHGVPLYPQSVASYIKKVLAAPKGPGPIVVHCSAGVGRTGTIILSDANLRMAAAEEAVDVLQYQQLIREQRSNLVDNLDQYKLVHLVLLECLIEDPTEMSCEGDVEARVRELRSTGVTERQFIRLYKQKNLRPATKNLGNPQKNRNQDIVPGATGRIFLSQIFLDDPTSTYINAVTVDGFRIKDQFVATQFPLSDTVGDFWRMVLEKNISLILVLNEINLSDEVVTEFLPETDAPLMPSPHISVNLNQVTDSERWTLKFLQINNTDQEGGVKQVSVRLLQFKDWTSDQTLPPSIDNFLLLWHEAERLYMGKGPILVTCLDGATACGLFLSLAFVVEKIKLEQLCDVCLAVRTVRQHRDQFVATQEQFEFLYDAATTYLEAFQTYANFQ